jgi:hypothetical protein
MLYNFNKKLQLNKYNLRRHNPLLRKHPKQLIIKREMRKLLEKSKRKRIRSILRLLKHLKRKCKRRKQQVRPIQNRK